MVVVSGGYKRSVLMSLLKDETQHEVHNKSSSRSFQVVFSMVDVERLELFWNGFGGGGGGAGGGGGCFRLLMKRSLGLNATKSTCCAITNC